MARPLRIEYPGAFYHIINRGLERRDLFKSKQDYEYFLGLLQRAAEKYSLRVHSYCLMTNHYHLFVETPNGQISKIMRQVDGNYTQKFNKKYNRVGPLMQGRYKAALIDKDSYSLQVSKYIHLNPVKAKMVGKPEEYPWSSYPIFIGNKKAFDFLETGWLLGQFSRSVRKAKKAFKAFTLENIEENWEPEKEAYKGLILGTADFIEQIKESFLSGKSDAEVPKLKQFQKGVTSEDIYKFIVALKQNKSIEKKLLIYGLKNHSPLSLKEIGERTGNVHYSGVSQANKRLLERLETEKKLLTLVRKIDNFCMMSNVKT